MLLLLIATCHRATRMVPEISDLLLWEMFAQSSCWFLECELEDHLVLEVLGLVRVSEFEGEVRYACHERCDGDAERAVGQRLRRC